MDEWLVILIKSFAFFILAFALVRIRGKRHPSKMTSFDFVNYIVMAILVALISVNVVTNWILGLVALLFWGLIPIGLEYLSLKSKWFYDFYNGKETVLIENGKIMEENLNKARMSGEDLLRELRSRNAFSLADVEFALLEPTGDINVLLKSDKTPVTPYDLGKKVSMTKEPQTVVLDGNIIDEALANSGLNRSWLNTQLNGMGVSLDNVFVGQVDSSGDLYVDLFDDSIQVPQPKVKEMLYANLEKCQADLLSYSLETQEEKAKKMYSNDANKLKELMDKLKPYLLN